MKYPRRWKIQMAAWWLWICKRSLQLPLKPPMCCVFVQGHSCWQDSQRYCRETSRRRTRVLFCPGKGKQKWAQTVFCKGHLISPNELGLRPTKPGHAMLPAVPLLPPHKSIFIGSFKLNVVVLFGTAMAKVPVSTKLPGLPMPTWFYGSILWFFD